LEADTSKVQFPDQVPAAFVSAYSMSWIYDFSSFFCLQKILNVHTASENFAELFLVLESNGNVETFREKLNGEYLEIPPDLVKRVLAGQRLTCLFKI
jgi:hypothetical protein